MPTYRPRVCIPSWQGTYERILSSQDLADQGIRGDNANIAELLIVSWTALLADSPVDSRKPNRVIDQFLFTLTNDLKGVIARYSSLFDALTRQVSVGEDSVIIDEFLVGMKQTPVFREYLHFYRTRDPLTLRFLLTFLTFGKKLYYESQELNATALREWREVEDRLRTAVLPPFVENLREVITWIFRDWEVGPLLPKYGGGAVAERDVRGITAKSRIFELSPKLNYMYNRNSIMDYPAWLPATPSSSAEVRTKSRVVSRLKFVPKDMKKTRSICMEPSAYMWAQQAVRLWYEDNLSRSILRKHVVLQDQGKNQWACRFGSFTNRVDTIDLSSASDSVQWQLVKKIFPAKVLKHLQATRTDTVELPDGSEFEVSKFAPMGSALCFPVQSTIYSAVILMVAMTQRFGVDWREPGVFKGLDLDVVYKMTFMNELSDEDSHKYQPFYAYGDDLICDQRITSNVIDALTELAFKVNVEKSYMGPSTYRESCGKHYFVGYDVSPIQFKVKKVSPRISIDSMAGVIDLANRCYEASLANLRRHLIQFILHYPIQGVRRVNKLNPVLFTTDPDDSFAILCDVPRNTHLEKRLFDEDDAEQFRLRFWFRSREKNVRGKWDEPTHLRYQRDEYRSITPGPHSKSKLPKKFNNYAYGVWWRSRYGSAGEPQDYGVADTKTDSLGVRVRWRWTAA